MKVDIAIPAYNEERNLGDLLLDLSRAEEQSWFTIQSIYVISDASDDNTDKIVLEKGKEDQRIKLIRKPERKGKWDSINLAFSQCEVDVLVLLDADVRLADKEAINNLVLPFLQEGVAMAAGNPVPVKPGFDFNVARQASYFGWILVDEIKRRTHSGFYSAHGRILALHRTLYKHLVLPDSPADDQYIYLSSVKGGLKFACAENSVVNYILPGTIGDYLKQSVRFRVNTSISEKIFGRELLERETKISGRMPILLSTLFCHPYNGFMWAVCYIVGKIRFLFDRLRKKYVSAKWDVAKTTK